MNIRGEAIGQWSVLHVTGNIDAINGDQLRGAVEEPLRNGATQVCLDLGGVEFINSAGLVALVSSLKAVRAKKGRFVLTGLRSYVQEVFQVTELDRFFDIVPSTAALTESAPSEK